MMIASDEIEKLSLHRFRPFYAHFNLTPFFIAYLIWFYIWSTEFGLGEYPELGMIVTACIALLQILTCLFCYWFVEIRVLMQCSNEKDPFKAQCVKIKPTANNGYAELINLNKKSIVMLIKFI